MEEGLLPDRIVVLVKPKEAKQEKEKKTKLSAVAVLLCDLKREKARNKPKICER